MCDMASVCPSIFWYRKSRGSKDYLNVDNNQPFGFRDYSLPLQSKGKAHSTSGIVFKLSSSARTFLTAKKVLLDAKLQQSLTPP